MLNLAQEHMLYEVDQIACLVRYFNDPEVCPISLLEQVHVVPGTLLTICKGFRLPCVLLLFSR